MSGKQRGARKEGEYRKRERLDGSRMLPNDGNELSLDYSHDDMLIIKYDKHNVMSINIDIINIKLVLCSEIRYIRT
jgi:hypothetical protein